MLVWILHKRQMRREVTAGEVTYEVERQDSVDDKMGDHSVALAEVRNKV